MRVFEFESKILNDLEADVKSAYSDFQACKETVEQARKHWETARTAYYDKIKSLVCELTGRTADDDLPDYLSHWL